MAHVTSTLKLRGHTRRSARPRAGLGCDVRHVGAGARGASARARHVGRRRRRRAAVPLLFSVHDDPAEGAAMLRFRCGPVHGQHGTKTNYCHNYWCHKLNMPHYRGLRDVALNV